MSWSASSAACDHVDGLMAKLCTELVVGIGAGPRLRAATVVPLAPGAPFVPGVPGAPAGPRCDHCTASSPGNLPFFFRHAPAAVVARSAPVFLLAQPWKTPCLSGIPPLSTA